MWRFTMKPKWHPQIYKHRMGSHYGDMFDRDFLLSRNPFDDHVLVDKDLIPLTNIKKKENEYIIELQVPGFKKEEVKIHLEDDVLTITGNKRSDDLGKSDFVLMEHNSDQFERSFQLSSKVDEENIKAKLKDGILYIKLLREKEPTFENEVKEITID